MQPPSCQKVGPAGKVLLGAQPAARPVKLARRHAQCCSSSDLGLLYPRGCGAGAQSPPGGHSSAEALPLPLQLGGPGHDSQLLLVLHAQAAPVGAAEQPAMSSPGSVSSSSASSKIEARSAGSDAERVAGAADPHAPDNRTVVDLQLGNGGRQLAAAANCLALRAHAAGWEEAAQCMHTYHVLAEQAQRQYAAAEEALAAGQHAPPRPAWLAAQRSAAAEPPGPRQAQEQAGAMSLRLAVDAVHLQLVADCDLPAHDGNRLDGDGEGLPARTPAAALQARLEVEAEQYPDGSSRTRVCIPGLLLAVGTVPAEAAAAAGREGSSGAAAGEQPTAPALVLPLQDSLLGIRDAELTLASQDQRAQRQPAATASEGSILLGPAHQVSLGASLAQVSVWVHPHNLCAATALAGHARALAAELATRLPMGAFEGGSGDRVRPTRAGLLGREGWPIDAAHIRLQSPCIMPTEWRVLARGMQVYVPVLLALASDVLRRPASASVPPRWRRPRPAWLAQQPALPVSSQ